MKKIIVTLFFICIFSLILSPVLAEQEKAQTGVEKKSENVSTKAANLEDQRTQNITRVRASVNARWNAYNKLIKSSGQLLDKLQIRIDKAKAAGQNTTNAEAAMTDARTKLADAKLKMDGLKSLVGVAMDKNSFKDVQKKFQDVHKDLNMVRQDAAKIISNLKSFNSSTKSAEIRSTSSAKER